MKTSFFKRKETKNCEYCNSKMLVDYIVCPSCGGIDSKSKKKI